MCWLDQALLELKFKKIYSTVLPALLFLFISYCDSAYALDTKKRIAKAASIDEVAHMIRKRKQWQILDASPRRKDSGTEYFRFKLLGNDGTVKIINVDPNKPNLRRLE